MCGCVDVFELVGKAGVSSGLLPLDLVAIGRDSSSLSIFDIVCDSMLFVYKSVIFDNVLLIIISDIVFSLINTFLSGWFHCPYLRYL